MKKISRIAALLHINEGQARVFCQKVQAQFHQAPSFESILAGLKQLPGDQLSVETLVDWLACNHPELKPHPPGIPRRTVIRAAATRLRVASPLMDLDDNDEAFSPALNHDPRKYLDPYEKCPHGVAKFGICAICEPEKYKFYYRID